MRRNLKWKLLVREELLCNHPTDAMRVAIEEAPIP